MKINIGKFRISIFRAFELSLASIVAAIISYVENESILWMILHYLLGVLYITYWMIKKVLFWIF